MIPMESIPKLALGLAFFHRVFNPLLFVPEATLLH
jgi:hypothetical protein